MIRLALLCAVILAESSAAAQDFPLTIKHKFGTTVIESQPQRIATVDYAGADDLLAMGVQPVAIRYWYGDQEGALWPWAAAKLTTHPEVLRGEINYEQIAAADPDIILALWSGITQGDYQQLSRIAPVVAAPEGVGDFALPWDRRARLVGRAVGREAEARARITAIRARLGTIAAAHPDWAGKTASVGFAMNGSPGAYSAHDIRAQLLAQMGFRLPRALVEAGGDDPSFAITLSEEALNVMDANLIVWIAPNGDFSAIDALLTRRFLSAAKGGHEVLAGELLSGALSHASLLSLPYALDALVPGIEAALDGQGPVIIE